MNEFGKVPVEPDTIIKKEKIIEVHGIRALHQRWVWEGIIADSLIFHDEDVESKTNDELICLAKDSGILEKDSSTTTKRSCSGYTFINMNFVTFL